MRYLALLLLAPWLIVLGWAYWAYPKKSLVLNVTRRAFDVLALVAAGLASLQCAMFAYDAVQLPPADQFGPKSGAIWQQVMPALYGYGAFLAVLLISLVIRQLVWKIRPSGRAASGP